MKTIKTKYQFYEVAFMFENRILVATFLICPDMGTICLN